MNYKTTFFSPDIGDMVFPITPTSLDAMTIGANVPVDIVANTITVADITLSGDIAVNDLDVTGDATFTGTLSGSAVTDYLAAPAAIGGTTPAGGAFTTLSASSTVTGTGMTDFVDAAIASKTPAVRYLSLTDVHSDDGLPLLTATAATTIPGIARTAGTSLALTGLATVDTTPATTKMIWEFDLPDSYVAAADIPLLINCVVPVAANVTAGSTTMTVAAYKVSNAGVETAVTVSAAQLIPLTTAATLTFTVTGTGLIAGQRMVLELIALVTTTAGGASSMQVNSVGMSA